MIADAVAAFWIAATLLIGLVGFEALGAVFGLSAQKKPDGKAP